MNYKIKLFKKIYNSDELTAGLLYQLFAEYNGGQIEIEYFTTTSSGKKRRGILRGVIDFIFIDQINRQEVVRVKFMWLAAKLNLKNKKFILTNYQSISFTKYQKEYFGKNPTYDKSAVLLLLDEDEDEKIADPNSYKVVKVDFIDGNDPNYLRFESLQNSD